VNRAAFFTSLRQRNSGVFGTSLSQAQVRGCEAILDACRRHEVTDDRHVANILAQVYHETGGYMMPIKETVMPHHKDKSPSDAEVIRRLDNAFSRGQLPWVKAPYWRDGWFGRGMIQITHRDNYERLGARLGINLVGNRALALDPRVSADIAVVGMAEGLFTGRRLSQYFGAAADNALGARRIVNGQDGTDATVAGYHRAFLAAIQAGGGIRDEAAERDAAPDNTHARPDTHEPKRGPVAGLVALLVAAAAIIVFLIGGN
jgi:predicted chitinase